MVGGRSGGSRMSMEVKQEIRRSTVVLSLAGTSSGKPARSYAALTSEWIALLTLGAAVSDAMLWRALVSTTKRTLKPARGKLSYK
jgi:hypothetical protein